MKIKFRYKLDDWVKDTFNRVGIITECITSQYGNAYLVVFSHGDVKWREDQLSPAQKPIETKG